MSSLWQRSPRVFLIPLLLLTAMAWVGASDAAQLSLAWTDNSTNEDGFKIEHKIGTNGTFAQIATVGASLTSYTNTGLATATTYCYRVRAYNTAGNSAYSNETCGTAAAFGFSLNNGGSQSVTQGLSVSNTINTALVWGTSQSVSFSASWLPKDATAVFSLTACSPTCSTILTISTKASTPTGFYTITVGGTGGGVTQTTSFGLTVNAPGSTARTVSFQDAVFPTSSYSGTRDNYISEPTPNTNYGTAGTLWVDGDNGTGKDVYALLRWKNMTIPVGSTVKSATITLNVTSPSGGTYELYAMKRDWWEGQSTWNVYGPGYNWQIPGAKGTSDRGIMVLGTVTAYSTGKYTITLNAAGIALVQSWVNFPNQNNGIIIADSTVSDGLGFDSRAASTATNRPKLTVTYAGSTFTGWSGGGCGGTGPCAVTLSANTSITATFAKPLNVKIGFFRPSTGRWYLDLNGNGQFDSCTVDACLGPFGQQGNLPVVGDWAGTGTLQIGVFDPSTGLWKLDRNGNDLWDDCTVDLCLGPFTQSGDRPVVGRWKTGASVDMIGIYRPKKRVWRLDLNSNGQFDSCTVDSCLGTFGTSSQLPVVGDWTGTGTAKIGVFDPSTGLWKLDRNGNGQLDSCTVDGCLGPFGISGDLPVVGDWTGTGKAQIGVFDPSSGLWELDLNGNGRWDGCAVDGCLGPFGQQGDIPVVGKW